MPHTRPFPAASNRFARFCFGALALGIAAARPVAVHAQEAAATVTVRGRVIDRASGQPIAGARVEFPQAKERLYTDGDGYFAVRGLPEGEQPISIVHLGHLRVMQSVSLRPGEHSFVIRMTADEVALQAITVSVNRMESRRIHSPMMSRVWGDSALARFRQPSTRAFLAANAGLQPTRCGSADLGEGSCAWIRGEPARVTVILDEQLALGGLDDLIGIAPQDLYRVEVYRGGGLVVAYTKQFVQTLAHNRSPLHPFSAFDRQAEAMGLQSLLGTETKAPGQ